MLPAWLARAAALLPDDRSWRPGVYRGDDPALGALVASGAVRAVHDTLLEQLGDLAETRSPRVRLAPEARRAAVEEILGGAPAHGYGAWVFYPWSGRLVHLLGPDEFRELRTDRNRYKITADEQARLRGATIGVAGLSVGQTAAVVLAMEGIGGKLRLADFDTLSLSNLNRLRAGVQDLGVSKAVLTARVLAEMDPWLEVEILPDGLREDNLDAFLDGLDLLVEECDDLRMKLLAREGARARGIPVVMDTSDRGLLDVERFDLEPDRPLLHGLVGGLRARELDGRTAREKLPIVLRILGEDSLSPRLAASLPEVRETISTWPQLASGVTLGGALVADSARRILLGSFRASGRYNVDLEALVRGGAGRFEQPLHEAPPPEPLPESRRPEAPVPAVPPGFPTVATGRALAAAASLAPSGHNLQPWTFTWTGDALEIRLDPARRLDALDFRDGGAFAALGAAALNAELVAAAAGLEPAYHSFPDPADPLLAARLHVSPGSARDVPLAAWIGRRVTNRRLGVRAPLGPARDALAAEAAHEDATLLLEDRPDALDALGALLGEVDRLSWLTEPLQRDIVGGLRWSPREVAASRDGLDVDTLELGAPERAGMAMLVRWEHCALLGRFGGGSGLAAAARDAVAGSSAIGLLRAPGSGPAAYLQGGRALQRLWLLATALGLAIHPVATLPYLLARRAAGDFAGWPPGFADRLAPVASGFHAIFPPTGNHVDVLLFRVAHAPPATARSVRRPLETVFNCRLP